jgi:hypothetical protein
MKTMFTVTILFLIAAVSITWIGTAKLARLAPEVIRVSIVTPGYR